MDNKELAEQLEKMVDDSTLGLVLETLATICFEKAEHIRTNWQDKLTAKWWDKDGERIQRCAGDVTN